jgi:hypothetical protein
MNKPLLNSVTEPTFTNPAVVVALYFDKAIEMLDTKWGEGYSKKNPATVAALVHSMVHALN